MLQAQPSVKGIDVRSFVLLAIGALVGGLFALDLGESRLQRECLGGEGFGRNNTPSLRWLSRLLPPRYCRCCRRPLYWKICPLNSNDSLSCP